jgi:hypothetical protein
MKALQRSLDANTVYPVMLMVVARLNRNAIFNSDFEVVVCTVHTQEKVLIPLKKQSCRRRLTGLNIRSCVSN